MGSEDVRVVILAQTLAGRIGLRSLLESEAGIDVIAEAANLEEVDADLDSADLIVIDGSVELGSLRRLGRVEGALGLVWVTDDREAASLIRQVPCRAWGIVPIDGSEEEFFAVIHGVNQGFVVASSRMLEYLWADKTPGPKNSTLESLTPRESEVLQLLAQGLANKQIGLELAISEHTVKFHISSIYGKLGATNRAEAVSLGLRYGLIDL
jgi:DNA-binding NarL/FixJ family response regulator